LPNLALVIVTTNHGKITSKWNGVVVSERQFFAALVFEVKDELLVFAIFSCKDLFPLKYGGIKLGATKIREDVSENIEDVFSAVHFRWAIVACALEDS
jgi:hypothetical protein